MKLVNAARQSNRETIVQGAVENMDNIQLNKLARSNLCMARLTLFESGLERRERLYDESSRSFPSF